MKLRSLACLFAAFLAAASIAAGQTEDFYEARLLAGYQAVRAQRIPEAIDQLRIAAFGLMDRPVLLTEALVRLALAQEAVATEEAASDTIKRFVEVERRFGGYARARLENPARTAFRNLLAKCVPAATIASLPSFGGPPAASTSPRAAPEPTPAPREKPSEEAARQDGLPVPAALPVQTTAPLQEARFLQFPSRF